MGLLFVAVSINSAKLASQDHRGGARQLAEQAFRSYSTALFLSLVVLYPTVSLVTLGRITLAITASSAVFSLVRLHAVITAPRSEGQKRDPGMPRRMLSAVGGYGLLILAEGQMGFFGQEARGTLATGALVLMSSAALTSWDLLINLAKA
jgi:hypothetical protein